MTEGVLGRRADTCSHPISYGSAVPHRRPLGLRSRKVFVLRARALELTRSAIGLVLSTASRLREQAYPLSQAGWRFICLLFALLFLFSGTIKRSALAFICKARHILFPLKALWRTRLNSRLAIILASSAVALVLIGTFFYSLGLEVILEGQSIGFVSSQQEFESAVAHVNDRASEILGRPYLLSPQVTYQYSLVDRHEIFSQADVEKQLFSQIDDVAYLYVLTVNDEPVGASADQASIQSVLDSVLAPVLQDGDSYDVGFVDAVEITHEWADKNLLTDRSALYQMLTSPIRETEIYELLPEEDFALVALSNGMSIDDLQSLNPELKSAQPEPVESLVLAQAVPFLSIESFQNDEYIQEIPFESITESDAGLYIGETEIRVAGVPGKSRIVDRVRYVNGNEDTRVTLSVVPLSEPVAEVTAIGTKKRPAKAPTGVFIYPCEGSLSSNYGYRRLFGGEFHSGIDLAASTGTPIVAADGGTVIFSGWQSGYGNCVMISHGKGVVSLYGHCSKLLVSEGQAVAKGERIAKVGSTGRSTGPHCHFEMRVDGERVSPWKFLN